MTHLASARAPYSLRPVAFPLPALAALGARASLGGPRETALACLLVGRLLIDAITPGAPPEDQRAARAQQARHWLGAAAVTPPVRAALGRLAEATGGADRTVMATALDSVIAVTANQLDPGARLELGKLLQMLAE